MPSLGRMQLLFSKLRTHRHSAPPLLAALCSFLFASVVWSAPADLPKQLSAAQREAASQIPDLTFMEVDQGVIPSQIYGDLDIFKPIAATWDQ
jgi:hypothetical protein